MAKDDRRLGKGLAALLGENLEPEAAGAREREVELTRIRPNPFQPRDDFDEKSIGELAESIRANGLLQPIVVREAGSGFEIVAGERRYRALQRLGWERAPIVTRALSDEQMLVVALVENLQRENLSVLEEARGYQRLIDEFDLTREEVGRYVGRDRSTVSNALRLLALSPSVQELVGRGELSGGHARALLALADEAAREELAARGAKEGWSVREMERRVKARAGSPVRARRPRTTSTHPSDPVATRAELVLSRALGTQVRVRAGSDGAGEIRVPFHDPDDFLRLLELLAGAAAARDVGG